MGCLILSIARLTQRSTSVEVSKIDAGPTCPASTPGRHRDLMRQRYFPPLARRLLDRERDFQRRFAPAGIVRRLAAREDCVAHVVEHGVAPGISAAARQREFALAGLAIDEHAVRGSAQLAARA